MALVPLSTVPLSTQPSAPARPVRLGGFQAFGHGSSCSTVSVLGSFAGTLAAATSMTRRKRHQAHMKVSRAVLKYSDIRPEIYRIGEAQRSFFYSQCPPEDPQKPEFAFFGQSNVGKSTMLNFLCNRRKLSTTSKHPGHTKLIHHYLCEKGFYLVDLPGTGRAQGKGRQLKQMSKIITAYVRHRSTLAELFYLVDGSEPFGNFDLQGIKWLVDSGVNLSVILTKMDMKAKDVKVGPTGDRADDLLDKLYDMPESPWRLKKDIEMPLVFKCSAKERTGREAVLEHIADVRRAIIKGRARQKKDQKQVKSLKPPAIR